MHIRYLIILLLLSLSNASIYSQNPQSVVNRLIEQGYENVNFDDSSGKYVYILQNSSYRVEADGISNAVNIIQSGGLPIGKDCSIIFLQNKIPQISINYRCNADSVNDSINCFDRSVSYVTNSQLKEIKGVKLKNNSLFKVNIVVYPELMFRNYILSKVYQYVFNISPAVEVSMWKGGKITAQVIFPLHNDYGVRYKQIRPGIVTISQDLRITNKLYLKACIGFFSKFRWGGDLSMKYILPDNHFWLDGRVGYTGKGYFENWAFNHGKKFITTGRLGMNYYWNRYNTQFRFSGERYIGGEYGMQAEVFRHFNYATIGLYFRKLEHLTLAANNGYNGGFEFRIAIPPFRLKRKGYIPRITGGSFGFRYQAGNEKLYGESYKDSPDDNIMEDNRFNPLFINSYLNPYKP